MSPAPAYPRPTRSITLADGDRLVRLPLIRAERVRTPPRSHLSLAPLVNLFAMLLGPASLFLVAKGLETGLL